MAETRKVLGQSNPAAAALTTLYTVPAATQVVGSSIIVCNRSTATSFRISIAVAGAADGLSQYIAYDVAIAANDSVILTIGYTLGAADVIRVYATAANLTFTAFGVEIT